MSRSTAKLTVFSCKRAPQTIDELRLEAFQLERQRDGELAYVDDDAPAGAPGIVPPRPGLVPFIDRSGDVLAWAVPPAAGVVILPTPRGERYFVRAPTGFVEVDAVRAQT